ncbi:MAG: galactosyltransferase-related protein, partial [Burkholderiaceae bacterium]|nr:galactosyltransferase-related protein [Burkholderiaceae bacterium]
IHSRTLARLFSPRPHPRLTRIHSCNQSFWRDDLLEVNGFDERFEGWGFEDSDLAIRLLNRGVRRKEGAFATGVLHLWHREHDRRFEARNRALLQQRIASGDVRAALGLDRYLTEEGQT